jgi:hypothetical protein
MMYIGSALDGYSTLSREIIRETQGRVQALSRICVQRISGPQMECSPAGVPAQQEVQTIWERRSHLKDMLDSPMTWFIRRLFSARG